MPRLDWVCRPQQVEVVTASPSIRQCSGRRPTHQRVSPVPTGRAFDPPIWSRIAGYNSQPHAPKLYHAGRPRASGSARATTKELKQRICHYRPPPESSAIALPANPIHLVISEVEAPVGDTLFLEDPTSSGRL